MLSPPALNAEVPMYTSAQYNFYILIERRHRCIECVRHTSPQLLLLIPVKIHTSPIFLPEALPLQQGIPMMPHPTEPQPRIPPASHPVHPFMNGYVISVWSSDSENCMYDIVALTLCLVGIPLSEAPVFPPKVYNSLLTGPGKESRLSGKV